MGRCQSRLLRGSFVLRHKLLHAVGSGILMYNPEYKSQGVYGEQMDTAEIIAQLEEQLENVKNALAALQGGRRTNGKAANKTVGPTNGRRRHMSAAARKKISDAAKARWARWKKAKA
jgi:hypothetical protein